MLPPITTQKNSLTTTQFDYFPFILPTYQQSLKIRCPTKPALRTTYDIDQLHQVHFDVNSVDYFNRFSAFIVLRYPTVLSSIHLLYILNCSKPEQLQMIMASAINTQTDDHNKANINSNIAKIADSKITNSNNNHNSR